MEMSGKYVLDVIEDSVNDYSCIFFSEDEFLIT